MSGADWKWVNLQGGFSEEYIADLSASDSEGASTGRGCIVVQTNATSSFHVTFSETAALPTRGSDNAVLRFVVGKRKNSMTAVGLGNPYIKKEPIEFTKNPEALLTDDPEKSRAYWFLYDRVVGVAAMGVMTSPQADLCRLVCRFRGAAGFDSLGLRAEACDNLGHVILGSGKRPVSMRVLRVCGPPDISIPRPRFDPEAWRALPWNGNSCVMELPDLHRALVERVQKLLADSPIAPYYGFVEPQCLCLNAYRLLDPLRRTELFPEQAGEDVDWMVCHKECYRRVQPLLESGPWTYWPLKFDRADCTSITLTAIGTAGTGAIKEWAKAMHSAAGLRNAAAGHREMLTLSFAFEVFPVEGEQAREARRALGRQITELLTKEWGIAELLHPKFVTWRTHTEYTAYTGAVESNGV